MLSLKIGQYPDGLCSSVTSVQISMDMQGENNMAIWIHVRVLSTGRLYI